MRHDVSKAESYASVWDAIADMPGQAANLRARAELMQKIAERLKRHDWTQAEAAKRCGVTQPRINDLIRGRVSRFSLDSLVNIATALGCRVHVDEHTPQQRRVIDARLAEGLADIKAGRTFGPFDSADRMIAHMKKQVRKGAVATKTKRAQ
jgi:predicted XRE-type DNA-binding protein